MKLKLFTLISFLLIPLYSYSQDTIQNQEKILSLNKYQVQCILRDRIELEYLRKVTYNDAVLIQELESKVTVHQQLENELVVLLDTKVEEVRKLKIKNKLILIGSGIVIGGITYLAIK